MFLFTTPASPATRPAAIAPGSTPHGHAIGAAAQATGVSFDYLVQTARRESGFRADAQAKTSTARGLYQFIEQTWLRTMRSEGASIGLGQAAAAIGIDQSGRAFVADAAERSRILGLRDDPAISARLAAALARDNAASLQERLGRAPSDGELYIAHFLGSSAAARLIRLKEDAPAAAAAAAFPSAAAANRSIFHDRTGAPRTAQAVYDRLVQGFVAGDATTAVAIAPAAADARRGAGSHPFFQLFRNAGDGPSAAFAAASLWRAAGAASRAGPPLDLNAFRIRSSRA